MLKVIKEGRPDYFTIPVYLGDSLQWSKDEVLGEYNLRIQVPEDKNTKAKRRELLFPQSICQDSVKFDKVLQKMIELAGKYKEQSAFKAWIQNQSADKHEYKILSNTYKDLLELQKENRNHIWGYIASNLARPIWLSSEKQKADVVIGNPPWLRFNAMNKEMQGKFTKECISSLLWEIQDKKNKSLNKKKINSSRFKTSQDISTYFFIMSVHLYMREKGALAFVMPYGVINGEHHSNFRTGHFEISGSYMDIKFKKAWTFDSQVKNLFEIPCCVLFCRKRKEKDESLPKNMISFKGKLPIKNCNLQHAKKHLSCKKKPWPHIEFDSLSHYFDKFKQGASLVPRRFAFVKEIQKGKLGGSSKTPFVKGVTSNLDKKPWNKVEPPENKVESKFLKPVYTGQSIAPFTILNNNIGIIPLDSESNVMNSAEAESKGYTNLGGYLEKVECLWKQHGKQNMSFKRRINYNGTLKNQFPISKLRVVYTASGTNIAAVFIKNSEVVIDYKLYWSEVNNENEGLYLEGVLNSDYLIDKIKPLQSQGQYGERDICRHLLKPPIPEYSPIEKIHQNIINYTKEIRKIAHSVEIDPSWNFRKSRKKIRSKIQQNEIWDQLNQLVKLLLEENQSSKKAS